jgi:creatinine amidohydrolase
MLPQRRAIVPAVRPLRLAELTWSEVDALDRGRVVPILPVGAVEAHGPHLPLSTDGVIAEAMAEAGAERLRARGLEPLVLPSLDYSAAPFANGFAGTLSIQPDTATRLIVDVGRALAHRGYERLVLVNAHLDPAHLGSLHAAREALEEAGILRVIFPDITRKPWALLLTDEFKSGACHAGSFEGSIVMAARPELVRDEVRRELPPNPVSLSRAIRDGLTSFEEAGGEQAYFGHPAEASAAEGQATVDTLGSIVERAVIEEMAGE